MEKRFRIGFLDEDAYDEYHNLLVQGISASARKHDIDVIRFGHFNVQVPLLNPYHEGMLIELVKQFRLDGLIFLGWARTVYNAEFRSDLEGIPMINIGSYLEGVPGVIFRGELYIMELLSHLADFHKFSRIAYIAPVRPDPRNSAYRDAMSIRSIYDRRLYISDTELTGLNLNERGRRAVEILLDERKVLPEAIVSLSNEETFAVISALRERGLKVPDDIAVTSYEDGETGRFSSPTFTTVYFPWKELGYYACEAMHRYLSKGGVPSRTEVAGRLMIRNSCGCIPQSAVSMEMGQMLSSHLKFDELDSIMTGQIVCSIAEKTPFCVEEIAELIDVFREAFFNNEYKPFLMEFEMKLRKLRFYDEYGEFERIAVVFREILMPYFLSYGNGSMDRIFWADNIFHQMQVILQNRLANVWFREDVEINRLKLTLKDVGKILFTSFNVKSLLDSLETNLPKIHIKGCWLYLFDDPVEHGPFGDYHLEFEYRGGKRIKRQEMCGASGYKGLEAALSRDDRYFLLVHFLYIGDVFIGFVLFESGQKDIRIAQNLSIIISTALNSIMLFQKLDQSYRKLMEQAHKKGMADTTGTLHNIANIMNSISVTYQALEDLLSDSCVKEFLMADCMLEKRLEDLDSFITNDPKGKLLMQYFVSLNDEFTLFRNRLNAYIDRLLDKTSLIEGVISSQQSVAGVRSNLERIEIMPVIEDVLKINQNFIEGNSIKVIIKGDKSIKALAQRIKLLHVLTNIVKNAIESMGDNDNKERVLTIVAEGDKEHTYIRVSDTGPGIRKDKLESIFAYGFTTKEKGHGFGLHSCANYMTEMKGRIWAENSISGRGAVFVMQFRTPSSL